MHLTKSEDHASSMLHISMLCKRNKILHSCNFSMCMIFMVTKCNLGIQKVLMRVREKARRKIDLLKPSLYTTYVILFATKLAIQGLR